MSEFIFFGCWNNVDCSNPTDYNFRDMVLDYVQKYEQDVQYLFLAGDNWYSNAIRETKLVKKANEDTETMITKKVKYYLTSVLESGYMKIYQLNKKTHIVLGNHDVNTDNTYHELKKDCMLNTQKFVLDYLSEMSERKTSYMPLSAPTLTTIKDYQKKEHASILLYEHIKFEKFKDYIVLFLNTNVFFSNTTRIGEEINIIRKTLQTIHSQNSTKLPIFVIGHHPILSLETKKDKVKLSNICEYCETYFDDLYNLLVEYNCIYLCADTHNFQILEINRNKKHETSQRYRSMQTNKLQMIKLKTSKSLTDIYKDTEDKLLEIVSGTGGGESTEICAPGIQTKLIRNYVNNKNYKYQMNGYGHNSFGYTKINVIDNNNIQITYIKIIDPTNTASVNIIKYIYNLQNINNAKGRWYISKHTKLSKTRTVVSKSRSIRKLPRNIDLSAYTNENICKTLIPLENKEYLKYAVKENDIYCFRK
jgi:hypothetical protein